MKRLFVTGFLLAAAIFQVSAVDADAQDRRVLARAQQVTGDRFTVAVTTPRGANVFAVNQPSAQMLAAIDQGLADLFSVSRKNRYSRRLNYRDYTIYIGKADRQRDSSGNYSPDIAVGAAQYTGTVYDQGGYIFAAGMVIWNSPAAFVIAEHDRDLKRVSDIVRYEGEHLVLYHNDRRRYEATKDHSQGGGHPILQ
ncbi:MAG: hypothetical protein AB7Q37_00140 [Pyrinomonadaceae bacterium]